ncbi:MAG: hypothetical protein RL236_1647 [Pseudomonadota bacterium]|jgi:uncharacterized protein YceK
MKKLVLLLVSLVALLNGCGTGVMRFRNEETKSNIECEGGVGWQAQANKKLCVESAINSGYKLQGHQ